MFITTYTKYTLHKKCTHNNQSNTIYYILKEATRFGVHDAILSPSTVSGLTMYHYAHVNGIPHACFSNIG
jgi:hypothetical protein